MPHDKWLQLRIPGELLARIRAAADRDDVKVSAWVRAACEAALNPKPVPAAVPPAPDMRRRMLNPGAAPAVPVDRNVQRRIDRLAKGLDKKRQ